MVLLCIIRSQHLQQSNDEQSVIRSNSQITEQASIRKKKKNQFVQDFREALATSRCITDLPLSPPCYLLLLLGASCALQWSAVQDWAGIQMSRNPQKSWDVILKLYFVRKWGLWEDTLSELHYTEVTSKKGPQEWTDLAAPLTAQRSQAPGSCSSRSGSAELYTGKCRAKKEKCLA